MRRWAMVIAITCAGCAPDMILGVDLRTDYEPGRDFVGVTTEIYRARDPRGGSPTPDASDDLTATSALDFYAGRRVAELEGLAPDVYFVRASLIAPDGSTLAARIVQLRLDASSIVTVVIGRTCEGVSCPGPSDPETETECAGGRCVDPRCGTPGATDCPIECEGAADCTLAHADCASARCESGACLLRPDDARCGAGMTCHAIDGCYASSFDAGPPPIDASTPIDGGPPGCTGECSPGATESSSQACGNCGSQPTSRTCGSDCRWGGWSASGSCGGEGPCSPGAVEPSSAGCECGGTQSCSRTCDGACNWGPTSCGACSAVFCADASDGSHVCPGANGLIGCGPPDCYRVCTCSSSGSWTSCDPGCLC